MKDLFVLIGYWSQSFPHSSHLFSSVASSPQSVAVASSCAPSLSSPSTERTGPSLMSGYTVRYRWEALEVVGECSPFCCLPVVAMTTFIEPRPYNWSWIIMRLLLFLVTFLLEHFVFSLDGGHCSLDGCSGSRETSNASIFSTRTVLGRKPHPLYDAHDRSDVYFSIKSTEKYHESRLQLLSLTWFQTVHPHNVSRDVIPCNVTNNNYCYYI